MRLTDAGTVANDFTQGLITPGGNGPANPSLKGFPAGGFISNCPIIAVN